MGAFADFFSLFFLQNKALWPSRAESIKQPVVGHCFSYFLQKFLFFRCDWGRKACIVFSLLAPFACAFFIGLMAALALKRPIFIEIARKKRKTLIKTKK